MQRLGLMIAALLAVQSRAPCSVEPAPGAGTQPPARDEALRKELIRMTEEDQASGSCVRSSPSDLLLCRDTREVRRDNQLALDRIIAEHGWPGVTLVGVDGQRAAWIKDRDLDWKSDARVGGGNAGTELTSGGGYCACSGPVSTFYQDADGDGAGDTGMPFPACSQPPGYAATAGDCSDADATAWAVPSEARDLILTDDISLRWSVPSDPGASSLTYDVIRSDVPNDFTSSASCIASNTSLTTATDVDAPAPDQVFYYLVRARNSGPGGVGPLGSRSDGTPRVALDCP